MNKTEKKQTWLQMLAIMNNDNDWFNNEEKVSIVQDLATKLKFDSSTLPKLGIWDDFKRSDFLYLLSEGYTSEQIAKAYGVSQTTFLNWKKNQGFINKKKSEILKEYANEILLIRISKTRHL